MSHSAQVHQYVQLYKANFLAFQNEVALGEKGAVPYPTDADFSEAVSAATEKIMKSFRGGSFTDHGVDSFYGYFSKTTYSTYIDAFHKKKRSVVYSSIEELQSEIVDVDNTPFLRADAEDWYAKAQSIIEGHGVRIKRVFICYVAAFCDRLKSGKNLPSYSPTQDVLQCVNKNCEKNPPPERKERYECLTVDKVRADIKQVRRIFEDLQKSKAGVTV